MSMLVAVTESAVASADREADSAGRSAHCRRQRGGRGGEASLSYFTEIDCGDK